MAVNVFSKNNRHSRNNSDATSMNGLLRSKHFINKFVEFNQIGALNLSNQQTKNVSSKQNPKIGVKFKTSTIKNLYTLLTDNSQEEVEVFCKNEHCELTDNQSTNNQSGNG